MVKKRKRGYAIRPKGFPTIRIFPSRPLPTDGPLKALRISGPNRVYVDLVYGSSFRSAFGDHRPAASGRCCPRGRESNGIRGTAGNSEKRKIGLIGRKRVGPGADAVRNQWVSPSTEINMVWIEKLNQGDDPKTSKA